LLLSANIVAQSEVAMQDSGVDGRAKRDSVFRSATVNIADGRQIECRVRNLSQTGVGVSHKGELRTGMALRIAIGKLPEVEATVVWANDTQAGVAFDGSIADEPSDTGQLNPGVNAGWLAEIGDAYQR
jgi:hypothetical protein